MKHAAKRLTMLIWLVAMFVSLSALAGVALRVFLWSAGL